MNISVLSVFPELYDPFVSTSLLGKAQEKGLIRCTVKSFFDYVAPKERIDAPSFGHGAGMLIRPDVVERAVSAQIAAHGPCHTVFFSPQGKKLTQPVMRTIAEKSQKTGHLLLIAGRYEGMDARVEEYYADDIISLGDFVLMSGDVPAMVLLEGISRLLPGVVGKTESIEKESFTGSFVDYPEYTAPVEWKGLHVPDVIRSGNHKAIHDWRQEQAVHKTVRQHFSWLRSHQATPQEKKLIEPHIPAHYVALLHSDVLVGPERVPGTTSVTSLDIHDIARSCATYGIKGFTIVTPLEDQKKIVETLLHFWQHGPGVTYNRVRHEAVNAVTIAATLAETIECIEKKHGVKPVIIATSARYTAHTSAITFFDQTRVWKEERPVLFIFGTGQGITPECLGLADFLLPPVGGISEFRHLSVRSAVAIILDRWLGFNQLEHNNDCHNANSQV